MSGARRFRQCLACALVAPAGDFIAHFDHGDRPWRGGTMERKCPECGYCGPTADFPVVRERPPGRAVSALRRAAFEDASGGPMDLAAFLDRPEAAPDERVGAP